MVHLFSLRKINKQSKNEKNSKAKKKNFLKIFGLKNQKAEATQKKDTKREKYLNLFKLPENGNRIIN